MAEMKKVPAIRFKGFSGGWEEATLGEVVDFFSGLTYTPNDVVGDNGTFVLRSSNVKNGEIVNADDVFVNSEVVNCENVKEGDIAVVVRNGSRSLIGKHAQIKREMKNTVIGAFMTGIRSEQPNFTNALLDTEQFNKEVEKNLGATINQITTGAFKRMSFCFPDADEQKQIGIYFQHLDKLISLHQTKVNKLTNLKKAMLEKMFPKQGADVPEIRFKGFAGNWVKKDLGEIGSTFTGLSGKTRDDFGHGEAKFITYMNVFSNPVSDPHLVEPIEIDGKQNAVQFGDVLFTTSSETPEEVGMSSIWLQNTSNTYLNSFCFGFRLTEKVDRYYLAYLLRSPTVRKKITFLAQGISRYNISKNKMMEISVPIPRETEEQSKIGSYFQNLDKTITLHQAELEKLNNLKKACLEKMFV